MQVRVLPGSPLIPNNLPQLSLLETLFVHVWRCRSSIDKPEVLRFRAKYLAIAHFGKLLRPYTGAWFVEVTQQAYTRLAALSVKSSRPEEAAFYAFLADQERETAALESSSRYAQFMRNQVAHRDADLARRSGAVMLLSGALLLATLFAVFLRSRSLRLSLLRPSRLAIALGVTSSAALFVSSLVLRLAYQPYAEILRYYIRDGDETGLTNLRAFLARAYALSGPSG